MQFGFVIDHARCIGCHACTVACKSENDVPLGSFRTWVKYTERGEFPTVKRHFAVLRCNQCSSAPCVTICPTRALSKHDNGIVDVDPALCIGCKSCMQGCPYDALYINPDSGTAQKCHFCEHRTERGLAPACAVVCPTEAIIPGDFDDPASLVSRLKAKGGMTARKLEAGTQPNVWYKEVDESAIRPSETNAAGGYLWSNQIEGPQLEAERFRASLEQRAEARTTYDVDQQPLWGWKVSLYLFTKSIAAGAGLAGLPYLLWGTTTDVAVTSALGLLFLAVTTVLLVVDLKRPERFLLILTHPNWSSWLVKGSYVLMAYGALLSAWLGAGWLERVPAGFARAGLGAASVVAGALAAGYTAFLFAQAKGRVLWMQSGLFLHLVIQAVAAGAALLLLCGSLGVLSDWSLGPLLLATALLANGFQTLTKSVRAPPGREREYADALALLTRGPYARRHWTLGPWLGTAAPLACLLAAWSLGPESSAGATLLVPCAAVLALIGLYSEEDLMVKAGQALSIS